MRLVSRPLRFQLSLMGADKKKRSAQGIGNIEVSRPLSQDSADRLD
jgi:hypothetical protein